MKLWKTLTIATAIAATTLSAFAKPAQSDIVDTAVGAGNFKTLTKLVTDAGLVDVLRGSGPFTVFAPTDAAFAKVPKATLDKLSKDKELLKKVLTYHVVAGQVLAKDVVKLNKAKTVEGSNIKIAVVNGKVVLNKNSTVVTADVMASNGVIHVIDSVLLPPAKTKKY